MENNQIKILWFSRHTMTNAQLSDLTEIYGSDGREVIVKQVSETARTAADVLQYCEDCDVLAVVLPINLMGDLLRQTKKPVIRDISSRMPTGNKTSNGEVEYQFVHAGWELVERVEVVTRRLSKPND